VLNVTITQQEADEMFDRFHTENPHVYTWFKRFARQLLAAGRTRLSGAMIIQRCRWEAHFSTTGDKFKINDRHTPSYVRKLIAEYPEFAGKFELRGRRYVQ
jgi:hypothetical protein